MDKLGELEDIDKDIDFDNVRTAVFICLILFALVAIIASCMGILACKIKNRCFTICYGCLLLPIWIAVIVVGSVAVYVATEGKDKIQDECVKVIQKLDDGINQISSSSVGTASVPTTGVVTCDEDYNADIKFTLDVYEAMKIGDNMCSENCPCLQNVATRNKWEELDKEEFDRCRDFNWSGTFTTYKQCIEETAALPTAATNFQRFAKELEAKDSWSTVKDLVIFFEDTYDCAGICQPAIFYFSKSIELGLPTGSCVGNLKDELNDEFGGLGAATLVSGILLMLTFVFQYCLWYKYD